MSCLLFLHFSLRLRNLFSFSLHFFSVGSALKVSRRYYSIVFAFLVSIGMSFFMSFALVLVNVGLVPNFLGIWLVGYAVSFLVSLPISLFLIPIIKKIVDKLTVE